MMGLGGGLEPSNVDDVAISISHNHCCSFVAWLFSRFMSGLYRFRKCGEFVSVIECVLSVFHSLYDSPFIRAVK